MMRTRIKVCGLTRAGDAEAAVAAGVDACGFIFAPSPRQLSIAQAALLASIVPPAVGRIGVFVDADLEVVEAAIAAAALTAVQFCGHETPEACSAVSVPVVKALAVGTDFGWTEAEPYRGHASALLLDTYDPQKAGGTSQTFAWHLIGEPPGWAPIFVAGGLHAGNVAECIHALHPYAVDVSSGVELAPGVKDAEKIAAFCAAVRAADQEESR